MEAGTDSLEQSENSKDLEFQEQGCHYLNFNFRKDERGKITFLNKVAEEILALPFSRVANRDIRLVLREMRIDTSFLDKDLQNQLITIRSQNILVNNMKILSRGNVAEGVITFKIAKEVEELELKLRTQLRTNGHTARFHFSDIVTNSPLMKRLVSRAQRMAPNDLGVLIFMDSRSCSCRTCGNA